VNLILGNNGDGKSSVLKGLALAALAPVIQRSGYLPYSLVRRPRINESVVKIRAVLTGSERLATSKRTSEIDLQAHIQPEGVGRRDFFVADEDASSPLVKRIRNDFDPAFFVVGYGATRRVEVEQYSEASAQKRRRPRYQRVATLFEDHIALRPLTAWLPAMERRKARRREVLSLMNACLPTEVRFEGKLDRQDKEYMFRFEGNETPFPALSDGYRAFIGWVADLLGHLCDVCPASGRLSRLSGIVLVDEIDLHLHPEWQRTIVPRVASAFPNLQFVLTSHSPLVTGTLSRANIFVTVEGSDGTPEVRQLSEEIHGKSAEQVLLSSYFGLQTTRAPSFERSLAKKAEDATGSTPIDAVKYIKALTEGSAALAPLPAGGPQSRRPPSRSRPSARRRAVEKVTTKSAKAKRRK